MSEEPDDFDSIMEALPWSLRNRVLDVLRGDAQDEIQERPRLDLLTTVRDREALTQWHSADSAKRATEAHEEIVQLLLAPVVDEGDEMR